MRAPAVSSRRCGTRSALAERVADEGGRVRIFPFTLERLRNMAFGARVRTLLNATWYEIDLALQIL